MPWTIKAPPIAEWQSPSGDTYKIHTVPTISTLGEGLTGKPLWSSQLIITKNNKDLSHPTVETWEQAVAIVRKSDPTAPSFEEFEIKF